MRGIPLVYALILPAYLSLPALEVVAFLHHISTTLRTQSVVLQKMTKRCIAHFFLIYLVAEIMIYLQLNPKLATFHAIEKIKKEVITSTAQSGGRYCISDLRSLAYHRLFFTW